MPAALTPAQVLAFVLLDLVVILLAARVMGTLANKVGQPFVVGEIVAGVLLGPTLLGATVFTWSDPWAFLSCDAALAATQGTPSITSCVFPPQARSVLGVIGQLALVFFMFLVGLELDWSRLKGRVGGVLVVAVGVVVIPVAVGFALVPVLFDDAFAAPDAARTGFALFVGAMLSVTAFPVMARILQEKGLSASPMGAIGVAAAAVVTVLMFLLVSVAVGVSGGDSTGTIAMTFVWTALYLLVMGTVVRRALEPVGRRYEEAGRLTPDLFAVFLLVALGSSYVAHQIGINVIVGAFVAGAVLPARTRLFRDLSSRLADLTGVLLLPVFLAFSGLNTDFTVLRAEHLPGLLVFLLAAIAAKWAGGAVSARAAGLSWAEGNVLGVLMNCRGLLVLVVALLGVTNGVITPVMQVGAVLVALVTTMMTGPLFDVLVRRVPAEAAEPVAPAVLPAATGVTRVLAVAEDLRDAPVVVDAAFRLAAAHAPADVVLLRAVPPSGTGQSIEASARDASEVERTARAAAILAPLAPAGVTLVEHTLVSPAPAEEVLVVAGSDVHAVVVAWRPAQRAPGLAERLVRDAGPGVVACRVTTTAPERREPVVLLSGATPAGLAAELAVAAAATVPRVVADADERALVDAAREAGTLVVAVPTPEEGELLGQGALAFGLAVASGPVYLVREPHVPAPGEPAVVADSARG